MDEEDNFHQFDAHFASPKPEAAGGARHVRTTNDAGATPISRAGFEARRPAATRILPPADRPAAGGGGGGGGAGPRTAAVAPRSATQGQGPHGDSELGGESELLGPRPHRALVTSAARVGGALSTPAPKHAGGGGEEPEPDFKHTTPPSAPPASLVRPVAITKWGPRQFLEGSHGMRLYLQ